MECYDIWFCRSPILTCANILLTISNALAEKINQVLRLPRFIIAIIGDHFEKFEANQECSFATTHWSISGLAVMVNTQKNQLTTIAVKPTEPKIVLVKPVHRKLTADPEFKHRGLCRALNHNLQHTVKWYNDHYVVNVEAIWPDDNWFYETASRSVLSRRGYKEMWKAIDVKQID